MIDPVLHLGQKPRTEAEVQTARANAVTDGKILREASFIERRQIECADDSYRPRAENWVRYSELMKGTGRPAPWAIIQALEAKPTKA